MWKYLGQTGKSWGNKAYLMKIMWGLKLFAFAELMAFMYHNKVIFVLYIVGVSYLLHFHF